MRMTGLWCGLTAAFVVMSAMAGDAERNSSELMNAAAYRAERRADGGVKVLFLGNSITLHMPLAAIGWTNACGMAASDAAHDYVHLVTAGIERETGRKADVRVRNVYEFEHDYANWKPAEKLKAEVDFAPDYLIVALGENVRDLRDEAQEQGYGRAFSGLLDCFSRDGKTVPRTVVRGVFWRNAAKDAAMSAAAAKHGAMFVRTDFEDEPGMRAGTECFAHPGVAAHPGDKGMAAIAERILVVLFPSKSEDGMRVNLGDGFDEERARSSDKVTR